MWGGHRHYVGATSRHPHTRFWEHEKGRGCRTTKYAVRAGVQLDLACIWTEASWKFEKVVKRYTNKWYYCPFCQDEMREARLNVKPRQKRKNIRS